MKILHPVLIAVLFAMAGPALGADDATAAKFRALEVAWSDVIKSQDTARLEDFLRPEYTLIVAVAGKPLEMVDRATWLKNLKDYVIHEFQFNDLAVREYGSTAVVSAHYTQKATVNGRDRSGEFFLVDVWVKTGNEWQVSTRYSSRPHQGKPAPAPVPPPG